MIYDKLFFGTIFAKYRKLYFEIYLQAKFQVPAGSPHCGVVSDYAAVAASLRLAKLPPVIHLYTHIPVSVSPLIRRQTIQPVAPDVFSHPVLQIGPDL